MRVPAVAVWPGKIKAGSIVEAPLHMVDWYPTLLKLTGVSLAQKHPLDGRDAWPAITQGAPSPHEDILHNITATGGAIRMGDWKLVENGQRSDGEDIAAAETPVATATKKKGAKKAAAAAESVATRVELFNLKADPYEKSNLAAANPEKVKELQARLAVYRQDTVPAKLSPAAPGYKAPKVWGEKD